MSTAAERLDPAPPVEIRLRDHVRVLGARALGHADLSAQLVDLREQARDDLVLARLLEGHVDALRILAEAGLEPAPDAIYAVWASTGSVTLQGSGPRRSPVLQGLKPFCSGARLVDRALVLVDSDQTLVEVSVKGVGGVRFDGRGWATSALRGTQTYAGTFDRAADRIVGEPRWYFERPGFWHGALAPAACWAGGAAGLLDYAHAHARDETHAKTHVGAMVATAWSMSASLEHATRAALADPDDGARRAYARALATRHIVERGCVDTIDHFGRLFGPRAMAYDADIARRLADLQLYIRQCHAERDLEALGAEFCDRSASEPLDPNWPL